MDEPPSSFLHFYQAENLLYFIVTVIFVFVAGILSASEAAFFAFEADDMDDIRKGKSAAEKRVASLLSDPRLLLSVLVLWKYVLLTACSIMLTLAIFFNEEGSTFGQALTLTLVFAFFGMILPKMYGSSHRLAVAMHVSKFCLWLTRISRSLVKPMVRFSITVEKKLESLAEENSVKELTHALALASSDEDTTNDQREILRGIVNFGTLNVGDVMRPQSEIHCVDATLNFHDLLIYIKKSGFSRIPVYRESFDKFEGVLYIKDLLPYLNEPKKFNWQKLLRPAYFVHESKKIDLLLKDFQEKRVHIALALDEGGKVSGIITLEDIIEEIIGDIHDESDEVGSYFKRLDEKTFIFDSKIPVHEFCRLMDADTGLFDVPEGENETLGTILGEMKNGLPEIGDQIVLEPFTFIIESVDHKRIKKVKVHIHEQKENEKK